MTPHLARMPPDVLPVPLRLSAGGATAFVLALPAHASVPTCTLFATPQGFAAVTPHLELLQHGFQSATPDNAKGEPFKYTAPARPPASAASGGAAGVGGGSGVWSYLFGSASAAAARTAEAAALAAEKAGKAVAEGGLHPPTGGPRPGGLVAKGVPLHRVSTVTADGAFLIAGGALDGALCVYSVGQGMACAQRLYAHTAPVCAVARSPCGRVVATAGRDCVIYIYTAYPVPGAPTVLSTALTAAERTAAATAAALMAVVAEPTWDAFEGLGTAPPAAASGADKAPPPTDRFGALLAAAALLPLINRPTVHASLLPLSCLSNLLTPDLTSPHLTTPHPAQTRPTPSGVRSTSSRASWTLQRRSWWTRTSTSSSRRAAAGARWPSRSSRGGSCGAWRS